MALLRITGVHDPKGKDSRHLARRHMRSDYLRHESKKERLILFTVQHLFCRYSLDSSHCARFAFVSLA